MSLLTCFVPTPLFLWPYPILRWRFRLLAFLYDVIRTPSTALPARCGESALDSRPRGGNCIGAYDRCRFVGTPYTGCWAIFFPLVMFCWALGLSACTCALRGALRQAHLLFWWVGYSLCRYGCPRAPYRESGYRALYAELLLTIAWVFFRSHLTPDLLPLHFGSDSVPNWFVSSSTPGYRCIFL